MNEQPLTHKSADKYGIIYVQESCAGGEETRQQNFNAKWSQQRLL